MSDYESTPGSTGRGVGRPRKNAITEASRMVIEQMLLRGHSYREIGEHLGVKKFAIEHQIKKYIRPVWQQRMESIREEEFAKVALLEKIAWERFEASKNPVKHVTIEKEAATAGADLKLVKRMLSKHRRTGEVCWLQVVQWCLDWRARMRGDYAAQKMQHTVSGDVRVAGMSAEQFTAETLAELMEALQARTPNVDADRIAVE
jgi:transposase